MFSPFCIFVIINKPQSLPVESPVIVFGQRSVASQGTRASAIPRSQPDREPDPVVNSRQLARWRGNLIFPTTKKGGLSRRFLHLQSVSHVSQNSRHSYGLKTAGLAIFPSSTESAAIICAVDTSLWDSLDSKIIQKVHHVNHCKNSVWGPNSLAKWCEIMFHRNRRSHSPGRTCGGVRGAFQSLDALVWHILGETTGAGFSRKQTLQNPLYYTFLTTMESELEWNSKKPGTFDSRPASGDVINTFRNPTWGVVSHTANCGAIG